MDSEFSIEALALPLELDMLGGVEKTGFAPPATVHACGCTCQCSGSYCERNLAQYCGDPVLSGFADASCRDHRTDINSVLRTNHIAAVFISCNGTIKVDAPTPSS
jgi:hypothetical protein